MSEFKLIKNIIEISVTKTWEEAKKEWDLYDINKSDIPSTCLCGKYPIIELCYLENRLNKNRTIVGNCCVNKFLGQTNQNKMFKALSKNKINKDIIELAHKRYLIVETEKKFLLDNWRKRNLNDNDRRWFDILNDRILKRYKNGQLR